MRLNLDLLEGVAAELQLSTMRTRESLTVRLEDDVELVFKNDQDDTLIGFVGSTMSHFHDALIVVGDEASWTYEPSDILRSLCDGTLLLVEEWEHGQLNDRYIGHSQQKMDFDYIQAGQEIRIRSMARSDTADGEGQ